MIGDVRVVSHGRPASEALALAVEGAKAGRPLAPVTVVVPSNLAGLTARRLLGEGIVGRGGIANVAFHTPFRLAELLAADRLVDRRPLTNPVLAAAVRAVLADDPGPYADAADHHATEVALATRYAELSNVDAAGLARVEAAGGRAAVAVEFQRRIAAQLEGYHHEADVADAAAGRPDLAAAVAPFGHVVWYLPEPVTPPLVRFVAAVLAAAPASAVVALTGREEADAAVRATCERAGVAVPVGGLPDGPPVADEIVSVTDADEEVRAVVRRIAALAEAGVRLDRIGVFHPVAQPYGAILDQQLAAAGIPANGPSTRRLADTVAGRVLRGALALPAQRWRRDRVMALLGTGPVRHGAGRAHPTAWELASRQAGVVQGLEDWRRKLALRRSVVHRALARLDDGAAAWRRDQLAREADAARELGEFVDGLAAGVDAVRAAVGWPDKSAAAAGLLHDLLGPGHRHGAWPEAEQDAFDRVDDALSRLAALGEIEASPTHAVFLRALDAELDVPAGRRGRFGEGVVHGPLAAAVGHDLDAVFVLGCVEGLAPSPRRDDAMLPDAARARAGGQLELRAGRLADQHRWFLAAVAAAPVGRRVVVVPRGDLRSSRRWLPSRWALDTASALAGRRIDAGEFADLRSPAVEVVPSHLAGVLGSPVHGSLAERDLAAVARHVGTGGALLDHPAAALAGRGLVAQLARRSDEFTVYDGNLEGQPIPVTTDVPQSPSRLESWAACGFRYFLAHVLGLAERDEPERVLDLSPLDRGSGVHAVLEAFLAEVIEAGAPLPGEPWGAGHRARVRELATQVFAEYEARGRTGRPVLWHLTRNEILAVLDGFLTADDAHRSGRRAVPQRVELPFGLDGTEPVRIALPDGRSLLFRGRIDRIDRADDGSLVVFDYKTGRGSDYEHVETGDPVHGGKVLQLGLYAEAARAHLGDAPVESRYWMVNRDAGFVRYGYEWTEERRARFLEVLGAIVDGIEHGVFAARPGEWDTFRRTHHECRYCDFDVVCVRDRGEHAAVKVLPPRLRHRAVLEGEPA